jgi:hypothetical protein
MLRYSLRGKRRDWIARTTRTQTSSKRIRNPTSRGSAMIGSTYSLQQSWKRLRPLCMACNETVDTQLTPYSTYTTSAASTTTTTLTTRTVTTQTITQTATTTMGSDARPNVPRAVMNMAAVTSEAAKIISSVLASGTTPAPAPTSTQKEQRIMAESGLANACSCEMVEPTATVTSEYTLPLVVSYMS